MDMAELKTFMQKQACILMDLTHRFKLSGIQALKPTGEHKKQPRLTNMIFVLDFNYMILECKQNFSILRIKMDIFIKWKHMARMLS